MPFGVRRRVVGGQKVCGGCAAGREGRPLTNHGKVVAASGDLDPLTCPNCGEGPVDWFENHRGYEGFGCPFCGVSGSDDDFDNWDQHRLSFRRSAAPVPPRFLQDPQRNPPPFDESMGEGGPGAEMPPPPPPGVPTPGTPGGGLGSFAPDRESDKVVRVCPFCGSGNVTGNSDGSIECGHEDVVFLVEVLPRHPFQPLVDQTGQPFEMNSEDEDVPEIGIARAEGPQPVDGPVDEDEDEDLPPFLRGGSLYITDEGVAMGEDAYVEHLARHFGG